MQPYPKAITTDNVVDVVQQIARLRIDDITDRNNFPSIFLLSRSVGKIPTSSTDIVATDRIGDFNATASFAYFCVDNGSGTAVWRRATLATW